MPAGSNQLANIYTYSYPTDDAIGGSQPSGTLAYQDVLVRISPIKPTIALLEQGMETIKLFETAVSFFVDNLQENDELLITEPIESPYYSQRFRVVSVQHPSLRPNDPRSQTKIILKRYEQAHSNAHQYG